MFPPAEAYLEALPEDERKQLSYKHQNGKWFSCSYCTTKEVLTDMHVGDVFLYDHSDRVEHEAARRDLDIA